MNNRILSYLDFFIVLLMSLLLTIDMVTGFYLEKGIHLPISQTAKFILSALLLMRITMSKLTRNIAVMFLFFLAYTVFLTLYFLLFAPQAIQTLILYSKFLITVFVYIYYYTLFQTQPQKTLQQIHTIITINTVVMIINIMGTVLLNIGTQMYTGTGGFGGKGFFYAGNEISALWIILFAYCMFHIFREKKRHKYIITGILLLTSLSMGTKTVIAGCILFSIVFLPRLINVNLLKKFNRLFLVSLVSVLLLVVVFYFIKNSGMLDRAMWFYDRYGWTSLLSNRDIYVAEKIAWFSASPLLMKCLGLGRFLTVEMDFFDTLLNFGYIGVLVVYTFYIKIWLTSRTHAKSGVFPFAKWSKYTLLLILAISFFTGHTIFSAMAGPFIGIAAALIFYKPTSNLTGQTIL